MAILTIGEAEQKQIETIITKAKAQPLPLAAVRSGHVNIASHSMRLQDRKPGFERPPSQHIIFPGGYRAAFSVEEQPPGLCSHLSVSVVGRSLPGLMPSPHAVAAIAEAFGVPFPPDHSWQEEFEPGEYAINLLSLLERRPLQ